MKYIALPLLLLLVTPTFADDHVVILLDTSGSMAEGMRSSHGVTKMLAAQKALCNLIGDMPTTTKMGLLTFSGWAFPLGPVDKTKAVNAIARTSPSGGTPLGEYMKIGADSLLTTREKNHGVGTYTLLVVTDGEATDEGVMIRNTSDIVSRGLTLKTIGVNLDRTHTLATKSVAYFDAHNPEILKEALKQAVAEVPAGNDNIEEDAYAMIAGIPGDMVPPIIGKITSTITFNQPIGEKPKIRVVDEKGNVSFIAEPTPEPETSWIPYIFMVIFAVVALVLLYEFIGKRR